MKNERERLIECLERMKQTYLYKLDGDSLGVMGDKYHQGFDMYELADFILAEKREALEDVRSEFAHDLDLESRYDYDYQRTESTVRAHNKIIIARNDAYAAIRAAIDERLYDLTKPQASSEVFSKITKEKE